jgi:hypothetical protein
MEGGRWLGFSWRAPIDRGLGGVAVTRIDVMGTAGAFIL